MQCAMGGSAVERSFPALREIDEDFGSGADVERLDGKRRAGLPGIRRDDDAPALRGRTGIGTDLDAVSRKAEHAHARRVLAVGDLGIPA